MKIQHFFDSQTFTLTYLLHDPKTKDAIIIDPVLDFDLESGDISHQSVKKLQSSISDQNLNVVMILETHAHADHISSSQVLKKLYPHAQVGIGEGITSVQETFKPILKLDSEFPTDGSQFDRLLKDQESIQAGSLTFQVISTPGHTPACNSFLFEDHLFTGDAIFMPDSGTGRCDFPKGSAQDLYESIQKLFKLPDATKIYVGHDYQPQGRDLQFQTTVGEQKSKNIHLVSDISRDDFIKLRTTRDAKLAAPRLLMPSIQANIDGGKTTSPEHMEVKREDDDIDVA